MGVETQRVGLHIAMIPQSDSSSNEKSRDTVHFVGKVYPDVLLTIDNIPKLAARLENGDEFLLKIKLENSELRIDCEVLDFSNKKFPDLHWAVSEIARSFVDLTSFTRGLALTFVLDRFIDQHGNQLKIVLPRYDLKNLFTIPFSVAFGMVIYDGKLRRILHDLTYTLVRPFLAPANCARAVEAVGQALLPGSTSSAQRWLVLQSTLRCSRDYLTFITDVSLAPRHGGAPRHSEGEIMEARRRAWIIINRYLEFKARGGVRPLPETEFPIL